MIKYSVLVDIQKDENDIPISVNHSDNKGSKWGWKIGKKNGKLNWKDKIKSKY